MIEFLTKSKNFNSIVFNGCFSMNFNHFKRLYNYYEHTGENLLDDYCKIIYLEWETDEQEDNYINSTDATTFLKILNKEIIKDLFSKDTIFRIKHYIQNGLKYYNDGLCNEGKIKRQIACSFTSKKIVRDWVFKKYGEKCLSCSSDKNISLDHVIPITKGGENIKENLQPLCKPCNSKKHDNIIDYR